MYCFPGEGRGPLNFPAFDVSAPEYLTFASRIVDKTPLQPPARMLKRAQSVASNPTSASSSPVGRSSSFRASPAGSPKKGEASEAQSPTARQDTMLEDDLCLPGQPRGLFAHLAHYSKLYDVMRSAYKANKITLKAESRSRFADLVRVTLEVLTVVVEAEGAAFQKYAEEVLGYFQVSKDRCGFGCVFAALRSNAVQLFSAFSHFCPANPASLSCTVPIRWWSFSSPAQCCSAFISSWLHFLVIPLEV